MTRFSNFFPVNGNKLRSILPLKKSRFRRRVPWYFAGRVEKRGTVVFFITLFYVFFYSFFFLCVRRSVHGSMILFWQATYFAEFSLACSTKRYWEACTVFPALATSFAWTQQKHSQKMAWNTLNLNLAKHAETVCILRALRRSTNLEYRVFNV